MSDIRNGEVVRVRNSWGTAHVICGVKIEVSVNEGARTASATIALMGGTNANSATLYARAFDCHINGVNKGHGPTINTVNSPKNGVWLIDLGKATVISVNYDNDGNAPAQRITGSWTMRGDIGINGTPTVDTWLHFPKIGPAYTYPSKPRISNVTATDNTITADVAVNSFGVGPARKLYAFTKVGSAQVNSNFRTANGSVTIRGLSSNTQYVVKAMVDNGALKSSSEPATIVTKTVARISDIRTLKDRKVEVDVLVGAGGKKYTPTITLQMKRDNENSWNNVGQASTLTKHTFTVPNMTEGESYQFRVKVATTAGEWISSPRTHQVPSSVFADIYRFEGVGSTAMNVYFNAHSVAHDTVQVEAYYRRSGRDDDWAVTSKITAVGGKGKFALTGLVPGVVSYDIYLKAVDGVGNQFISVTKKFKTGAGLKPVENHNCKSLAYINELICQSLESIKKGNLYIYANQDTKEDCDDDSSIPTLASIVSRVRRAYDAYACILCQTLTIPKAKKNEYYAGEVGWREMSTVATENDEALITSKATKAHIDTIENSSWHYDGAYDYISNNLTAMANIGANNETLILSTGSVPTLYKRVNGAWVSQGSMASKIENMSVVKIKKRGVVSSSPADVIFGVITAGAMVYFFNNQWHTLNFNGTEAKALIGEITDDLSNAIEYNYGDKNDIVFTSSGQFKVINSTTAETVTSDFSPFGQTTSRYFTARNLDHTATVAVDVAIPSWADKVIDKQRVPVSFSFYIYADTTRIGHKLLIHAYSGDNGQFVHTFHGPGRLPVNELWIPKGKWILVSGWGVFPFNKVATNNGNRATIKLFFRNINGATFYINQPVVRVAMPTFATVNTLGLTILVSPKGKNNNVLQHLTPNANYLIIKEGDFI